MFFVREFFLSVDLQPYQVQHIDSLDMNHTDHFLWTTLAQVLGRYYSRGMLDLAKEKKIIIIIELSTQNKISKFALIIRHTKDASL